MKTAENSRTKAGNTPDQGFHVLIAAAGQGQRLGGDTPKQYLKIGGKPVLRHTLDNILNWPGLKSVRVIIDPAHAELYHDCVRGLDLPDFLTGGNERKISINNAINNISDILDKDIILIHDAARPCVSWNDVAPMIEALRTTHRAATLAFPVSDTLRRSEGDAVDREDLWALQTPQGFYFGDLKKAHAQAGTDENYTDDTGLISKAGIPVKLVPGPRTNIKITTPGDLEMVEALLLSRFETRTGTGFDVHAFEDKNTGRRLMLCGIAVDHPRALAGHSDADVGLHALTDALLGTVGGGDIGQHFPPSDPAFKNMDSAVFLEKAVRMLADKGGTILNLDVTLICETPKIGPCREAMRGRIAEICGIDPARVNVKATTTEGLGFTGRGEGIAAQAVATVKVTA